jgi:hypothetical protein
MDAPLAPKLCAGVLGRALLQGVLPPEAIPELCQPIEGGEVRRALVAPALRYVKVGETRGLLRHAAAISHAVLQSWFGVFPTIQVLNTSCILPSQCSRALCWGIIVVFAQSRAETLRRPHVTWLVPMKPAPCSAGPGGRGQAQGAGGRPEGQRLPGGRPRAGPAGPAPCGRILVTGGSHGACSMNRFGLVITSPEACQTWQGLHVAVH